MLEIAIIVLILSAAVTYSFNRKEMKGRHAFIPVHMDHALLAHRMAGQQITVQSSEAVNYWLDLLFYTNQFKAIGPAIYFGDRVYTKAGLCDFVSSYSDSYAQQHVSSAQIANFIRSYYGV